RRGGDRDVRVLALLAVAADVPAHAAQAKPGLNVLEKGHRHRARDRPHIEVVRTRRAECDAPAHGMDPPAGGPLHSDGAGFRADVDITCVADGHASAGRLEPAVPRAAVDVEAPGGAAQLEGGDVLDPDARARCRDTGVAQPTSKL